MIYTTITLVDDEGSLTTCDDKVELVPDDESEDEVYVPSPTMHLRLVQIVVIAQVQTTNSKRFFIFWHNFQLIEQLEGRTSGCASFARFETIYRTCHSRLISILVVIMVSMMVWTPILPFNLARASFSVTSILGFRHRCYSKRLLSSKWLLKTLLLLGFYLPIFYNLSMLCNPISLNSLSNKSPKLLQNC